MYEEIDIFDANLNPIGRMERLAAHRAGHWHKTIHCWVINPKQKDGSILFQLRGRDVHSHANLFDISAAGHIRAGESELEALREVDEELGISVNPDGIHYLGHRIEACDWHKKGEHNREYCSTYLIVNELPLSAYRPQVEEVEGLFWISVRDTQALFAGAADTISASGIILNEDRTSYVPCQKTLNRDAFVPRTQNIYLTVAIMAERLLNGNFPIAVS